MKHIRLTHENCIDVHCNICDLYICAVCNCAEGSLPTDCPGDKISGDLQDLIYNQVIDFKDGEWIALSGGRYKPIGMRRWKR